MRRFLLDSNAVNAFINHREPLYQRGREARLRGDRLGTCEPVIAELYYGLEFSSSRDVNIERLNRGLSQLRSWPVWSRFLPPGAASNSTLAQSRRNRCAEHLGLHFFGPAIE